MGPVFTQNPFFDLYGDHGTECDYGLEELKKQEFGIGEIK